MLTGGSEPAQRRVVGAPRSARRGGTDRQRLPRLPGLEHGHGARRDRRCRGRAAAGRLERRLRGAPCGARVRTSRSTCPGSRFAISRATRCACASASTVRSPRDASRSASPTPRSGATTRAARRTTPATGSSRRARSRGSSARTMDGRRLQRVPRAGRIRVGRPRRPRERGQPLPVARRPRARHPRSSRASRSGTGASTVRHPRPGERRDRAQPVEPARHDRRCARARTSGGSCSSRARATPCSAGSPPRTTADAPCAPISRASGSDSSCAPRHSGANPAAIGPNVYFRTGVSGRPANSDDE